MSNIAIQCSFYNSCGSILTKIKSVFKTFNINYYIQIFASKNHKEKLTRLLKPLFQTYINIGLLYVN